MHSLAHSHNKRELAGSRPAHPPLEAGRQAGTSQSQKARCILYQTLSRLPVANQDFLGFWTVDIRREGHSQRSAPQRRHMAHLTGWDGGGDKTQLPPGESVLAKHLVA